MSDWIPLDSAWLLAAMETPTAIERPEMLGVLKTQLTTAKRALLRVNPENPKNIVYYFHDPLSHGWAVASSIEVESPKADFMFNLLPNGQLGAVQVWLKD